MIKECLYVDDLIGGADSEGEAWKTSEEIGEAGLPLKKWRTNREDQQGNLPNPRESGKEDVSLSEEPTKVLGLVWKPQEDYYSYQTQPLLKRCENTKMVCTKRMVIQITSSIFYPLGFLSPVVLKGKMLFQRLWEKGLSWDENLPDDLQAEWVKWIGEFPVLSKLRVPRWY